MTEQITALNDFNVSGRDLLRGNVQIASFETPIREIARLDDLLFVIVDPNRHDRDPTYMGTNLVCLGPLGRMLWRAPNLNNRPGWHPAYYFDLRLFDSTAPKIHVKFDDRGWCYLDAHTGERLFLDPKYDWSNYPVAWKQLTEDQDRITQSVFAPTLKFYPKLG